MSKLAAPPLKTIALNRMAFGPRVEDYAAYDALGSTDEARFAAYVVQQLEPKSIDDSEFETQLSGAGFETLKKSQSALWTDYYRDPTDSTQPATPRNELRMLKFNRAIHSKRQLQEVLADFWHDHFNVSGGGTPERSLLMAYDRDVIRPNILGNFRSMLEAVTQSSTMLYYLDNYNNKVAGPNENFARELLELHTLGAENYLGIKRQADVPGYPDNPIGYVDDDVYEATRCLTGWSVSNQKNDATIGDSGDFYYKAAWHDRFQKTVLGRYFPSDQGPLTDGLQLLDTLAAHPGTATFICRKLCRRLIADAPPESIVNSAAAVFKNNVSSPDQLKRVVEHILLSAEFRTTWGEKIKRPFALLVGAIRAVNGDFLLKPNDDMTTSLLWYFSHTGHRSFHWPSPDGYPDVKEHWVNSAALLLSWRGINRLFTQADANGVDRINVFGETPASLSNAAELADYWIERVLGRSITASDRQVIVDFMAQTDSADTPLDLTDNKVRERLASMVGIILMSPEFLYR